MGIPVSLDHSTPFPSVDGDDLWLGRTKCLPCHSVDVYWID